MVGGVCFFCPKPLGLSTYDYGFEVDKGTNAFWPQFTAYTRLFDASKGDAWIRAHNFVDADGSCLEPQSYVKCRLLIF